MNYKYLFFLLLVSIGKVSFAQSDKITVPVAGNYFNSNGKSSDVKVYVRFAKTGKFDLTLVLANKAAKDLKLGIKMNNQQKDVVINKGEATAASLSNWEIADTGYQAIEIKYLSGAKNDSVKELILTGNAINEKASYVKNNDGNFFYWGRRGPSVHLNYQLPENIEATWFYNELIVPKGNDVEGSYFMANGFGEGYFGIQVNSPTERRVLFSVWSPFKTDNPKEIPEDHKIVLLKKGAAVYTGEFGNEGAGGQSYLKYNWKAETTYKFLLNAVPSADNYTTYTAYFFAPELNKWLLIASFKRPQTQTYIKRPHSFLENFIPEMGDKERMVYFKNQWVYDTQGSWTELNAARFTTDNTGNVNYRKDYAGGVSGNEFFLRNCGFFNNFTPVKTIFTKQKNNQKPEIDFSKLP